MHRTSYITNIIALFGSASFHDMNSLVTVCCISILNCLYFLYSVRATEQEHPLRDALTLSMLSISVSLSAMLRFEDPMDWIIPSAAMIWTSFSIPFVHTFKELYKESLFQSVHCGEWAFSLFLSFMMGIIGGVPVFVGWGLFLLAFPFAVWCFPETTTRVVSDYFKGFLFMIYFSWNIVNVAVHTLWSKSVLSVLSFFILIEFGLHLRGKGHTAGELISNRM